MSQVFISYAREDRQLVKPLAHRLADLGWLVWWDPEIRFGTGFRQSIQTALRESVCVIVLWSRDSVKSTFVCAEAEEGRKRGILLPILLDKVEAPLPFGELQSVDFTGWSGKPTDPVFDALLEEVERLAGSPSPAFEEKDDEDEVTLQADSETPQQIVVLFAPDDKAFLKEKASTKVSEFLKFLQSIALDEKLALWWDEHGEHPEWDAEVEQRLENAEVVLLVESVSLLLSTYVRSRRAWRAYQRLKKRGALCLRVRYQPTPKHDYEWLEGTLSVPKDGVPLDGRSDRLAVYKEMTDLIQEKLHGRRKPIRARKAMGSIRRLDPSMLSEAQLRLLQKAACDHAEKFVPDRKLRESICTAAKELFGENGKPLSKNQLANIDRQVLLPKEKRKKPDPKKVRWVLRCYGLHPQARVRVQN